MRQTNGRGVIVPHLLPEAKTLPDAHVIVFSDQDFPNAESIASRFSRSVEIVALTRGVKGVTLLSGGEKIELPAIQIRKEIDPTGAGDVFGVVFGIELHAKILSMQRALPCGPLPGLSKALVWGVCRRLSSVSTAIKMIQKAGKYYRMTNGTALFRSKKGTKSDCLCKRDGSCLPPLI